MNEEYKIWNKNVWFLYDLVTTNYIEWPLLIIQWLHNYDEPPRKDYFIQKIILGTHIFNDKPTYLILPQVELPLQNVENCTKQYDDECGEIGGFGCANGNVWLMFLSMLLLIGVVVLVIYLQW